MFGCQHRQESTTRGGALLVCPGEACGWMYGTPGAALPDLDSRNVEFITLDAVGTQA